MAEEVRKENGAAGNTAVPIEKNGFNQNDFLLKVKPFKYDGEEYNTVDLRKLRTMTARQMQKVETTLINEGLGTQAVWTSLRGTAVLAAVLNEKPNDWLNELNALDGLSVRNVVFAFFTGMVWME